MVDDPHYDFCRHNAHQHADRYLYAEVGDSLVGELPDIDVGDGRHCEQERHGIVASALELEQRAEILLEREPF